MIQQALFFCSESDESTMKPLHFYLFFYFISFEKDEKKNCDIKKKCCLAFLKIIFHLNDFDHQKIFFKKCFRPSNSNFLFIAPPPPSRLLNENGGGTRLDCRISARVMSCATTWAFYVTTTRLIMKATREG